MATDRNPSKVGQAIRDITKADFYHKGRVKLLDGSAWDYNEDEDGLENWFSRDITVRGLAVATCHFNVRGFDEEGTAHVRLCILHPLSDADLLYNQAMTVDRQGSVTLVDDSEEETVTTDNLSQDELDELIISIADDLLDD